MNEKKYRIRKVKKKQTITEEMKMDIQIQE